MSKNTGAFERLSRDKKDRIIHACIDEFAASGYELASTNRMVKKAGVAKGSLFKYFGTKENLYFAVASHVLAEYRRHMSMAKDNMPSDLLERLVTIQYRIYDFFGSDLSMFRFFKRVMTERGGIIHLKFREKWEPLTKPIFMEFLEGVDLSKLKISVPELMQVIGWLDAAVDSEVFSAMGADSMINDFKKAYREKMDIAIKVLKGGIYR